MLVTFVELLYKQKLQQFNSKLMLGDVTAAVRVVASDDSVLEVTPEVLSALRLKHPAAPLDVENIVIPPDTEELSPY